jgi:tetratricopeptide (TPR) repeat protein
MDYAGVCFVIMPFGCKRVAFEDGAERVVDFDWIYDSVFAPAIAVATRPEGGTLTPHRTDRDFFAGMIPQEMFEYIQHARFAVADVSGLNPNVFYELGVRHSTCGSGTAIFRQLGAPIPYDISQVKAVEYAVEPVEEVPASCALVKQVLEESLRQERLDSPVHAALSRQRGYGHEIQALLREAEDAIRGADWAAAAARYRSAVAQKPRDPVLRFKLGLMLGRHGRRGEAAEQLAAVCSAAPDYAEAHRELGIAQNKLYHRSGGSTGPDGRAALERAIALDPHDADALASLGGVLARAGELEAALARYRRAADLSGLASYPLLNALKLETVLAGRLELDEARRFQLRRAERTLRARLAADPRHDLPWSLFDLAEIQLYLGDGDEFLRQLEEGLLACHHRGEAETLLQSLQRLVAAGLDLRGLRAGIERIESVRPYLPPAEG